MDRFLFKREHCRDKLLNNQICIQGENCVIENITLSVFGKLYAANEAHCIKETLSRIRFALLSKNRAKIFYVRDRNRIVHTSYVIPKCVKFPFLRQNDFEIGPCYTDKEYRGLSIASKVLNHIVSSGEGGTIYYMIVSDTNESSIRCIQKAGFESCGKIYRTKFKCYKLMRNKREERI